MTLVIAEAGVNHNGDEDLALKLVDAAHKSGADIVKFQTFQAKDLVTSKAHKAQYQYHYNVLQSLKTSYGKALDELTSRAEILDEKCFEVGIVLYVPLR